MTAHDREEAVTVREALTQLVRQFHALGVRDAQGHRPGAHLTCDNRFCQVATEALDGSDAASRDELQRFAAEHWPYLGWGKDGLPFLRCACGWNDLSDTGWGDHTSAAIERGHVA